MQSWSSADGEWSAMEDGVGGRVWRPRQTAIEAAVKCLTWTGLIGIPAMQVVDLASGEVVWRHSDQYPSSGAPVVPEWHARAVAAARADLRADDDLGGAPVAGDGPPAQPDLLDLLGSMEAAS